MAARVREQAGARDEGLVRRYVDQLADAGADVSAFDPVFDKLQADKRLRLADVIAISQRYSKSRARPASKTLAFASISKRFVEVVQAAKGLKAHHP